ncbi:MAG: arginase family protein [Bacilli bacterium]
MKLELICASTDAGLQINGAAQGSLDIYETLKNNNNYKNNIKLLLQKDFTKSYDVLNNKKNIKQVNEFNENLYNEVLSSIKNNKLPLIIGGDHSISIASSLASKHETTEYLIWIDSHGDYNTFDTTITGNIHGTPFATITNQNGYTLTPFHNSTFYNPQNTYLIGSRSIDPKEQINIEKAQVNNYSSSYVKTNNIHTLINEIFNNIKDNKVHISFDIDVIDPLIAPGVSIPEENGLTFNESFLILKEILKHKNNIASIDLVEYNPLLDKNNKTKDILIKLIDEIYNTYK